MGVTILTAAVLMLGCGGKAGTKDAASADVLETAEEIGAPVDLAQDVQPWTDVAAEILPRIDAGADAQTVDLEP